MVRQKRNLFSILFFITSHTGYIVDKETKEPLTGVRIISDCDTTYTDFSGKYNIKLHNKTINIDMISYEKMKLNKPAYNGAEMVLLLWLKLFYFIDKLNV